MTLARWTIALGLTANLGLAPQVFAQEAAPEPEVATEEAPPATAPADPVAAPQADTSGIEEIFVTINKRSESVQDIPGSIVGFSPETIEEANVENLGDMMSLLPNVQVKSEETDISVRGVARAAFDSQSPVAQHINGVYTFNGLAYVGQFYDLEGIDVALGPSGTLYGRNATGGAIDLRWHKPTASLESFGDFTYSPEFDGYQFRGGVNVPLSGEGNDLLNARFVLQREVSDSTTENLLGTDRQGFGAKDEWSARAYFTSQLTEDFRAELRFKYVDSTSRYAGGTLIDRSALPIGELGLGNAGNCGPTGNCPFDWANGFTQFKATLLGAPTIWRLVSRAEFLGGFFPSQNAALEDILLNGRDIDGNPATLEIPPLVRNAGFFALPGPSLVSDPRKVRSRLHELGSGFLRVWGADATLEYGLHELPLFGEVDLTLVGGYHHVENEGLSDADGTELGALDTRSAQLPDAWGTFELRAQSNNESWLNWTLGFFYVNDSIKQTRATLTPLFVSGAKLTQSDVGYAPFGNVVIKPIDAIEITLGARWNHDHFQRKEQPLPSPFDPAPMLLDASEVFRVTTLDALVKWRINEDHMVYAKWSRGYKSGFVQRIPASATGPAETLHVSPENIIATELGFKTTWFDGRLNLNGAAFHYDYKDLQVPVIRQTQIVNSNADRATVWGVELIADAQPIDNFSLRFAMGWLSAVIDEFCVTDPLNPPAVPDPFCVQKRLAAPPNKQAQIGNQNLAGFTLEDSPEFKVSMISNYDWDLGSYGSLSPTLEFTWTADGYRRPFNVPSTDLSEAYTKTDVRVRWSQAEKLYWVELFGENLEDNIVYPRGIAVAVTGTAQGFGLLQPRTYGIRLGFDWGK